MTELQVKSLIINDEIAKKLFFDGHFLAILGRFL